MTKYSKNSKFMYMFKIHRKVTQNFTMYHYICIFYVFFLHYQFFVNKLLIARVSAKRFTFILFYCLKFLSKVPLTLNRQNNILLRTDKISSKFLQFTPGKTITVLKTFIVQCSNSQINIYPDAYCRMFLFIKLATSTSR